MRVAVRKEPAAGERRVSLVPDGARRLGSHGIAVRVEAGAGAFAGASDDDYRAAGAEVVQHAAQLYLGVDVALQIGPPDVEQVARLREGTTLISFLHAHSAPALVAALAQRRITALAVERIPRTTLAQMMDVLSSQATLAGYRAVLLAAAALPKVFPMLMTAAGTITPARVLVLGAGVAGLQAVATARRLGAVVEAFDVRKVVKEQVESLGARFVAVDADEDAEGAGGYAKEASPAYQQRQHALIHKHAAAADVCISTALIPGRPAPLLLTEEHVRCMRPGSVIVDLAAEQGGNCALTQRGQHIVTESGVTIIGELNLPSQLAVHASAMYSRNMEKLLLHIIRDGALELNVDDEIVRGMLMTRGGDVVHPALRQAAAPKG